MDNVVAIIIAFLGSSVVTELVKYFIMKSKRETERAEHERKQEERFAKIEKGQQKHEKDLVRTHLLLLLLLRPEAKDEIMKVAEHYFKDLHGNWFATDIFIGWLEDEHMRKPSWLE